MYDLTQSRSILSNDPEQLFNISKSMFLFKQDAIGWRARELPQKRFYDKNSSFIFRVRAENSDSSKSVNVAIFSFLLTTVGQFMFLSACLSRTREVKQVFFIPIVA